jgi:ketosteroid isomerase-like protein
VLSVEDRLDITQLYARYNHAIDSGDAAGWAACFLPDGTFSSPATGRVAGTAALEGFAANFAKNVRARHWTNNLLIEPAPGGATGKCYLMMLRLEAGKPPSPGATGVYTDSIVKTADGWKFKSREVAIDQ